MKINLRLLFTAIVSIFDDVLIIILLVWVMSLLGIRTPWWVICILALILLIWGFVGYRALSRNPTLGFENVVGRSGVVVEQLTPKGTVRIGHELWQARSTKNIERNSQIRVISQSGLNLIVVGSHDSRTIIGL